jgi:hypothetical protein
MFYIIVILAVIVTVIVMRFVYNKTKSLLFINSFQLVDGVLYKDKLPYDGAVRINEVGGARAYFDFNGGNLSRISLYMKDGASVNWRVGDKYLNCYDREGKSLSQGGFEALYNRFVDANSMLEIFNRNFKRCQLAI